MSFFPLLTLAALLLAWPLEPLRCQPVSWETEAEQALARGDAAEAERLANEAHGEDRSGAAEEWLGRVAAARGQHDSAARHFESARDRGRPVAAFAQAWAAALQQLERNEEACGVFDQALSDGQPDPGLAYLAGSCYLALGEAQGAVGYLEQAYQGGLRHTGVVLRLARAQMETGREDRALDLVTPIVQTTESANLLLEIGKLLFQRVLYRQAGDAFRRAWELEPGYYDVGMYLALSHYLLEEYDASAQVLTGITLQNPPVEYHYLLGSVYARLGEPEKARDELEHSLRQAPDRADGYMNLGLFYLEQGDSARAMQLLEAGSARVRAGAKVFYTVRSRENCNGLSPPEPSEKPDPERGAFYSHLGDTLLEGRHWGSALAVYLLALEKDSTAGDAYGGIGLVCQELGTPRVGLEFLKRGVDLYPRNARLHYYLGSLYEFLSDPEQAIASYQTALRLAGAESPALYWVRLGLAQIAGGQPAAAATSFEAAIERDPGSAEAHYQLGKLYLSQRRFDAAETILAKAVELDASLQEAYYSYGLACIRNGKEAKGKQMLRSYQRRKALRQAQAHGGGMSAESPDMPRMEP